MKMKVGAPKECGSGILPVLSQYIAGRENKMNLGQPWSTQRYHIGHQGGRMAESVPTLFWKLGPTRDARMCA